MRKSVILILCLPLFIPLAAQEGLEQLGRQHNFISKRISSYDRAGGNNDRLSIPAGETAVLADISGPGAIHHIWITVAAEPFYGEKIVLRMYWDGEKAPSVEAPLGDFFGVGHGLNRNVYSLPIACSSQGRARNCYWYMPFRKKARITVTNEGEDAVGAFYYYIDYRALASLPPDTPYFHAQYHQEMPCSPGANYLLLEARGRGHYVGCSLSILQRAMGWWGEGDDMIFVDGEPSPSLHGTGSEDYFSDAWGMREDAHLFYGCPLQEPDFKTGAKATVYRFHIPDPIPFKRDLRVTIEHGHDNDRADFFSSVAYWYQVEPHKTFVPLPDVKDRLPFAQPAPVGFSPPDWEEKTRDSARVFSEQMGNVLLSGRNLTLNSSSFYDEKGKRYSFISSENVPSGTPVNLTLDVDVGEFYDVDLYFFSGPRMGNVRVGPAGDVFEGYSEERKLGKLTLKNVRLREGKNDFTLEVTGNAPESRGYDFAFVGAAFHPSSRKFIRNWNLIGPFDAPDMSFLQVPYPPEKEFDKSGRYTGKNGRVCSWTPFHAPESGYVRLDDWVDPSERGIVYGFASVYAPDDRGALVYIGSDDGVRVWINGVLVHSNPAYRGASPDQDRIDVKLHKGWNSVLIKILQGAGGWGYYVRFVDPDGILRYSPDLLR